MWTGQMSPWQLDFVLGVPRNLPLNVGQNQISNCRDIADIEFVVGGGWCKVIFVSNPTVELSWGWVGVLTIYKVPSMWWKVTMTNVVLFQWFSSSVTTVWLNQKFSYFHRWVNWVIVGVVIGNKKKIAQSKNLEREYLEGYKSVA